MTDRWLPLALWTLAVAALFAWFNRTDWWPTDRWIVVAIVAAMLSWAAAMLAYSAAWGHRNLALLSFALGVAGMMWPALAFFFGGVPDQPAWGVDLNRALLTAASILLLWSVGRLAYDRRQGDE